jgi:hypothetical protein
VGPTTSTNGREKSRIYKDSIPGPSRLKQVAIPTNTNGINFNISNLLNLKTIFAYYIYFFL